MLQKISLQQIDGIEDLGGDLEQGLPSLQPMPRNNTQVISVQSYWRAFGSGSGNYGSMNFVHACPVNRKDCRVIGMAFQVQGGVTGTNYVEVGIYDSLPDGRPGDLLRMMTRTVTTNAGNQRLDLSVPIEVGEGSDRLWLGYCTRVMASSSIQLVHSNITGLGAQEIGCHDAEWFNSSNMSSFVISSTSPTGVDGARTWPASFGTFGISNNQAHPNLTLRLTKPGTV